MLGDKQCWPANPRRPRNQGPSTPQGPLGKDGRGLDVGPGACAVQSIGLWSCRDTEAVKALEIKSASSALVETLKGERKDSSGMGMGNGMKSSFFFLPHRAASMEQERMLDENSWKGGDGEGLRDIHTPLGPL